MLWYSSIFFLLQIVASCSMIWKTKKRDKCLWNSFNGLINRTWLLLKGAIIRISMVVWTWSLWRFQIVACKQHFCVIFSLHITFTKPSLQIVSGTNHVVSRKLDESFQWFRTTQCTRQPFGLCNIVFFMLHQRRNGSKFWIVSDYNERFII